MKRLLVCLVLVVSACSGSGEVTWDLSDPVDGTDLGALSPQIVEVDGPGPISVRFPSGRVVEFDDFVRAQAARAGESSTNFLDQVRIRGVNSGGIDEIEEFAAVFVDEWGPATSSDGTGLDEFVQTIAAEPASRDDHVFMGERQDGILPTLEISIGRERLSAIARFDFDP